jgi:hypothetical protein
MNKQTKIMDYFYSEKTENLNEMNDKLENLRSECMRIRNSCDRQSYDSSQFILDMGTLTEYVLTLGDKINSMK